MIGARPAGYTKTYESNRAPGCCRGLANEQEAPPLMAPRTSGSTRGRTRSPLQPWEQILDQSLLPANRFRTLLPPSFTPSMIQAHLRPFHNLLLHRLIGARQLRKVYPAELASSPHAISSTDQVEHPLQAIDSIPGTWAWLCLIPSRGSDCRRLLATYVGWRMIRSDTPSQHLLI